MAGDPETTPCGCMAEDPGDGYGLRVMTHLSLCVEHPESDGATHEAVVDRSDSRTGESYYAWCPSCGWRGRKFRDEGYARAAAEKHDGRDAVR